ncbi:MAG TPA: phosphate ABC transporter substrate-binding protein PstS [Cyanobacteria bacterium UBA11049]|nr:phosphate ABC transporter substrate-binding protein PstS [Cyanobacteria bacterium UBA11049]
MTPILRSNRRAFLSALAILSFGVAACQSNPPSTPSANSPAAPAAEGGGDVSATLSGAGASFPAPLYQRWFAELNKQYPGLQISYQSVGSGAGVEQFLAGTVDFGATDAPLKDEERQQFQSKYSAEPIQIPMTGGEVVFAYNLEGVENLQLSRQAYCGIVAGEITNWNDPAIAQANEGAQLPDQPINFVHRSDGSGTTFIFTTHLAEACPNWQAGASKSVEWPTGTGAKGNEGITAQVQQSPGSIGYVEYAYANENGLTMATLENKAGEFVAPSPESGTAALEGQQPGDDFALSVPDPDGQDAYPIVGLTYLLLYPQYDDPNKAKAIQSMVDWATTDGKQYATELGYIPLDDQLSDRVKQTVDEKLGGK